MFGFLVAQLFGTVLVVRTTGKLLPLWGAFLLCLYAIQTALHILLESAR